MICILICILIWIWIAGQPRANAPRDGERGERVLAVAHARGAEATRRHHFGHAAIAAIAAITAAAAAAVRRTHRRRRRRRRRRGVVPPPQRHSMLPTPARQRSHQRTILAHHFRTRPDALLHTHERQHRLQAHMDRSPPPTHGNK